MKFRLSQRQTIPIELLIALPAQTFVQLLRGMIVDRRLQGQAVGLRVLCQLMSALHQGTSHAKLARLHSHVEVVEDPLSRQIHRREHGIEMHKADRSRVVTGEEQPVSYTHLTLPT